MEDKLNIRQKLLLIQTKLNAPKNQFNKFGKYSYRSCEDILEAVKPLLAEVGATLVLKDDIVFVGDRYYIKSTATLTDADEPNDSIETTAFAREEDSKSGMAAAQLTGSTSSYARKYCISALLILDDCKDPDSNEQHEERKGRTERKIICSDCGNQLSDVDYGGKHYPAPGIAKISQNKHNRVLCWNCMLNMKG